MKINTPSYPILSMRNIHVRYGETKALNGVDFDLFPGEIHALVGEHRAGKSSLVKILSGAARVYAGEVMYEGKKWNSFNPKTSLKMKVGIVYQDLTVIPHLSTLENIFTGQMIKTWYFMLNHSCMRKMTEDLFSKLGYKFDYTVPLFKLTPAQQYMVEFARALMIQPKILILDELSNKLTPNEMKIIYRAIPEYRKKGTGIIYISHDMDEILRLANRVTILKDGYRRCTERVKDLDKYRLFQLTYSYKLDQQQLNQSESKFIIMKRFLESIIHNLPAGVVLLDADNSIRLVNYKASEMIRKEPDYFIGKDFDVILDELDIRERNEIRYALNSRNNSSWNECAFADDSVVKISTAPLLDEEYTYLGTTILFENTNFNNQIDDYILKSEKMSSIAEVAVGVAHEINNPLFIVKNYLELIKTKNCDENIELKLSKIEKEIQRIVEIISSLLSFSKIRDIPGHTVNLNHLIEETILLLSHKISLKNIAVKKSFTSSPCIVRGNENKLKQVFLNLIINSIDAVLDHGSIVIETSRKKKENPVRVIIRDNGNGIPLEIQDKIFSPFFSTKVGKSNTGLGLSICRHIIEEHEGEISFSSKPGKGTEFCVDLKAV